MTTYTIYIDTEMFRTVHSVAELLTAVLEVIEADYRFDLIHIFDGETEITPDFEGILTQY